MAIQPFPHSYAVALSEAHELTAGRRSPIATGTAPQFGGSDEVWSPEELLVGALITCVRATFDAYASKAGLVGYSWSGSANGTLAKGRSGPEFSSIRLHIELEVGAGEEERGTNILARAERDCIISRTIKAPVEMTMNIVTRPLAAPAPSG